MILYRLKLHQREHQQPSLCPVLFVFWVCFGAVLFVVCSTISQQAPSVAEPQIQLPALSVW
jgi:hypothetical protein